MINQVQWRKIFNTQSCEKGGSEAASPGCF